MFMEVLIVAASELCCLSYNSSLDQKIKVLVNKINDKFRLLPWIAPLLEHPYMERLMFNSISGRMFPLPVTSQIMSEFQFKYVSHGCP